MNFPRVVLACLAGAAVLAPQMATAATPPEILGVFKNWTAYTTGTGNGKVCYALSKPIATEPRKLHRDPAYFLINDWPDRRAKGEPEIVPGYLYKDASSVDAEVGGARFTLFTKNDGGVGGAWVEAQADEARLIDAMKAANEIAVSGTSKRGTTVRDTYSTAGLSDALDKIHQSCGM